MRALRWDEKAAIECGFVNALSWDGGATLRSCGGNLKVDRLVTFGVMDMQRQANQNCPRTLQLSAAIHAFHIGISTDGDYIFRQKQGTVCSMLPHHQLVHHFPTWSAILFGYGILEEKITTERF